METRDRRPKGRQLTNSLSDSDDTAFSPPSGIEEENLAQLFFNQVKSRGRNCFARCRDIDDNQWVLYSWREAGFHVAALAEELRRRGVKEGEHIAILSGTRYEWVLADLAILSIGAISVPIYHSLPAKEVAFLLHDAEIRGVFIENQSQYDKIVQSVAEPIEIPETEDSKAETVRVKAPWIISFEKIDAPASSLPADLFWGRVPKLAEGTPPPFVPTARRRTDHATIVYTSGTTGMPKGVLQTHGNHLGMLDGVLRSGLLGTGERVFLFLPLAHSFARLVEFAAVAAGGDLIFPTVIDRKETKFDAKRILSDVASSEPYVFPSVPRIFEKLMDSISAKQRGPGGKIISWAFEQKRKDTAGWRASLAGLMLGKIRKKIFGTRIRSGISGGAPISVEVLKFFDLLGLPIYEGYGLTETTPAISANTSRFRKIGTVGRPFEGCEVRIDENDGEIITRGVNIAEGYWHRPHATAEAWKDGWFHTGDVGEIDEEGFIKITDRKKDLIVTAGGKKIPPSHLEGRLKLSPLVSQCLIYGDRRPYLVALVTLDEKVVRETLEARGVTETSALASSPRVQELLDTEIRNLNTQLATFEQIKRFSILSEDFTVENGLLSPTLKMKRKEVVKRFEQQIERLYNGRGAD